MKFVVGLAMSAALSAPALAQDVAPLSEPLAIVEAVHVAAGSVVELEIDETVTSSTHQRGQKFALRLASPIRTDEGVLIPAGAVGVGEVISASKAGMFGKPGELLLAARYIEHDGQRVPRRTFRLGASGENNTAVVMAASFVVPVAFLIKGGDIHIPIGTRANAKLAADLRLPVLPPQSAAESPSPPQEQESSQ